MHVLGTGPLQRKECLGAGPGNVLVLDPSWGRERHCTWKKGCFIARPLMQEESTSWETYSLLPMTRVWQGDVPIVDPSPDGSGTKTFWSPS